MLRISFYISHIFSMLIASCAIRKNRTETEAEEEIAQVEELNNMSSESGLNLAFEQNDNYRKNMVAMGAELIDKLQKIPKESLANNAQDLAKQLDLVGIYDEIVVGNLRNPVSNPSRDLMIAANSIFWATSAAGGLTQKVWLTILKTRKELFAISSTNIQNAHASSFLNGEVENLLYL